MKYWGLSSTVLRATLAVLERLDIFPEQRAAIRLELDLREWAAAIETSLYRTIRWCRGGAS